MTRIRTTEERPLVKIGARAYDLEIASHALMGADAWELSHSCPNGGNGVVAEEAGRARLSDDYVRALARESGATEQQIRDIASLIGTDRSSILREARLLTRGQG